MLNHPPGAATNVALARAIYGDAANRQVDDLMDVVYDLPPAEFAALDVDAVRLHCGYDPAELERVKVVTDATPTLTAAVVPHSDGTDRLVTMWRDADGQNRVMYLVVPRIGPVAA